MARLEIPVSGWTCLRTVEKDALVNVGIEKSAKRRDLLMRKESDR
jgi:hypothetical protein